MSDSKFTHQALGMYKIPQTGEQGTRYVVVKIPYNPETGETGTILEVCKDIREDSIDKFKVEASAFFGE